MATSIGTLLTPAFSSKQVKNPAYLSAPAYLFSLQDSKSQDFQIFSQKVLRSFQFELFQKKLEQKYDPQVVKLLFEKLKKLQKSSLTLEDRKRFTVWCHYLDVEQRFLKNIYKKHAPTHRLLKHLLRYTQNEVYFRMRKAYQGPTLTHENVEQCEKNLYTFLDLQSALIETFGEEICHRALTKVELYPSEILVGQHPYPPLKELTKQIESYFLEELSIAKIIEESSFEELNQRAEEIKSRLHYVSNYKAAKHLFTLLALKTGRTKWLKATLPKSLIQQQAELFEASRLSHDWANTQKELIPLHESGGLKTLNTVYFLKGAPTSEQPVAVFKEAKQSSAYETLMYDISVIFGLQSAFAPTKLTRVQNKFGSLQSFQNGISWNQFYDLYLPKEEFYEIPSLPYPDPYLPLNALKPWSALKKDHLTELFFNRYYAMHRKQTEHIPISPLECLDAYCAPLQRKSLPFSYKPWELLKAKKLQPIVLNRLYATFKGNLDTFEKIRPESFIIPYLKPPPKKVFTKDFKECFHEFENELFNRVSMEDYLKAGLGTLLLGNRDLHTGNFFFVPQANGQYSLVMFDNELSLYPSNYVICDHQNQAHLPARNALLIFPQADVILSGEMKNTLKNYINTFDSKFNQFLDYLQSPKGKSILEYLPHKEIHHYSLKAFKERIEKLIRLFNSDQDFTYREIYYQVFPLYETYLKLVQIIEPLYPEMLVGYHPAEELCDIALEKKAITQEQKEEILKFIHSFEAY